MALFCGASGEWVQAASTISAVENVSACTIAVKLRRTAANDYALCGNVGTSTNHGFSLNLWNDGNAYVGMSKIEVFE